MSITSIEDPDTVVASIDDAPRAAARSAASPGVVRNVIWNWAGVIAEAAVGFLLTPFLIHRLGDDSYGVWILIGSLTGYLGLIDFGLRGSVGRYVALYWARGDRQGLYTTITSALGLLACAAAAAFVIVLAICAAAPHLLNLSTVSESEFRLALLIAGVQLSVFIVLRSCDAILWGLARFDLLNRVDIPSALARGLLSAVVVGLGGGLVGLACVVFAVTVTTGAVKAILCKRSLPGFALRRQYLSAARCRELAMYGIWNFVASLAGMARSQLAPFCIGVWLGLAMVTVYSIATRLIQYAAMLLSASFGVLTPVATALHATDRTDAQRKLFLTSSQVSVASAMFFLGNFMFLGPLLLKLWLAPRFESAWLPLVVLFAGEVLPIVAMAGNNAVLGMARHRRLAWLALAETAIGFPLGGLLAIDFGMVGLCAGLALSSALCRGVLAIVYSCRILDIPVGTYLLRYLAPAFLLGLVPLSALALGVAWYRPNTWLGLVACGAAFSGLFVLVWAAWWRETIFTTRFGARVLRAIRLTA